MTNKRINKPKIEILILSSNIMLAASWDTPSGTVIITYKVHLSWKDHFKFLPELTL